MNMVKLYIDNIVFSLQKSGGISIVWYELLKRLISSELMGNICFLEYNLAKTNLFRRILPLPQDGIMRKHYFLLSIQRYINPKIRDKNKFIFHSSYYRTCSSSNAINITTVHDFTYEYYVSGIKKKIHCYQKYRAIRHSDYIICVSENTRKDLLKFVPNINPDKIRVIYNGVSDDYSLLSGYNEAELPYEKKSYAIFVGSRASYKNFSLSVKALRNTTLNLVIVGSSLTKEELCLLEKNLEGRYYYAGRISNKKLNLFYNGAFCLLYPSSYEGFGIPVLEAQKAGCPVIAMNASSIPEIIGDTPLLLKELSCSAVKRSLTDLYNENLREQIIRKGIKNAQRFTWDRMYSQVKDLYDYILNQNESFHNNSNL